MKKLLIVTILLLMTTPAHSACWEYFNADRLNINRELARVERTRKQLEKGSKEIPVLGLFGGDWRFFLKVLNWVRGSLTKTRRSILTVEAIHQYKEGQFKSEEYERIFEEYVTDVRVLIAQKTGKEFIEKPNVKKALKKVIAETMYNMASNDKICKKETLHRQASINRYVDIVLYSAGYIDKIVKAKVYKSYLFPSLKDDLKDNEEESFDLEYSSL